jgi:hypothetical protein
VGSQLHTLTLKRSTGETIPPDVIPLKHRCIDFEQQDSGVEVFFEDGKIVQADLLIGADGANSAAGGHRGRDSDLYGANVLLCRHSMSFKKSSCSKNIVAL